MYMKVIKLQFFKHISQFSAFINSHWLFFFMYNKLDSIAYQSYPGKNIETNYKCSFKEEAKAEKW